MQRQGGVHSMASEDRPGPIQKSNNIHDIQQLDNKQHIAIMSQYSATANG